MLNTSLWAAQLLKKKKKKSSHLKERRATSLVPRAWQRPLSARAAAIKGKELARGVTPRCPRVLQLVSFLAFVANPRASRFNFGGTEKHVLPDIDQNGNGSSDGNTNRHCGHNSRGIDLIMQMVCV